MANEITDQQLIDASTDATNLGLVLNGPATGAGSTVTLRGGGTLPTVAKALTIATGPAGPTGPQGPAITPATLVGAAGATQALAFATFGDVAYDLTLSADCAITFPTPAARGGTIVGAPTFGAGKFGTGLTACSDANYISTNIKLGAAGFTAELWLKAPAGVNALALSVVANGGADLPFWVGSFGGLLACGSTLTAAGDFTGGPNITDGAWHHVAVSYDGTAVRLYCDGTLINTRATNGSYAGAQTRLTYIGRYGDTGFGFNGGIDEVAIYNYAKYTGGTYTVPIAPYVGTETGASELYHLDGNAGDAVLSQEYRKITLVIRPGGHQATLPASSSVIAWAGGAAPVPSTTAVTVLTMGYTGAAPIFGGI